MEKYITETTFVPISVKIIGLTDDEFINVFNKFDYPTLLSMLDTQIETENYEICPLIHEALNSKI